MEQFLKTLLKDGYLTSKTSDGSDVLCINTPCHFLIGEKVVDSLKANYNVAEEVGGVLWAKPIRKDDELIFIIEKVSFIRNAIEDNKRLDNRNKTNAYLRDFDEYKIALKDIFESEYLPIEFHTHPTKGEDLFSSFSKTVLNLETSTQDRKVSDIGLKIGDTKLLMPDALIVGNDMLQDDLFIGLYNGFIAPKGFENSKTQIQKENIDQIFELATDTKLTSNQKLGLGIGGVLLIALILKKPKYSIPIILGLLALLPLLLTNTDNIEEPKYFNKLSKGDAKIFIP